MTPYKSMRGLASNLSDADISMDGSHGSESMVASPPKASRGRGRTSGTFGSRLFDDDDEVEVDRKPSVLKPLDLNLELSGEAEADLSSPRKLKPMDPMQQRKRHAELHIGRDLSFDDVNESPVEMHASPHISPSCYRSPLAYRAHKSPCIRTMDGRTVQSKNPFSPMYLDDAAGAPTVKPAPLSDSLNFPVSFEDDSRKNEGKEGPLLRHRLQKRDTLLDPSTLKCVSAHYNMFTRDGYPEKQGRYSFTGSPIKEMDSGNGAIPYKVPRRNKEEDAAAAASQKEDGNRKPLQLSTRSSYYGQRCDDISPTDVLSFPMMSLSSPSNVPPTPSKPKHYRRRPKTRYTPVRMPVVPQTPMPERRCRSFEEDDEDHDTAPLIPQSRFYGDFDVIGELGNGSFGNVFKVLSRLDGCMYAIKVAHRPAKGISDKERMLNEVYALAALSDQADTATFHIVRYHQAWMEENRLYIQTELCTATLAAEMQQSRISVQRRYKFLREICLALEFIHKNGMVHLDIKPPNIFVKNDQFKLGDFGLVSKISSHDVEEGDSRYMSSELLSGDHADLTKSDVFSLGITLYEVCLGGRPLPTSGPEWQALRSANFLPLHDTPEEMQKLIRVMMNPSYRSRPSASELLKHPQLLSEEQKALLEERNKVVQANLALAAQADRLRRLSPKPPKVPRKGFLVRANTWNGG